MPSSPLSETTPDEQLLERMVAGDEQAFIALFRRRRGEVYRFALHMTGSGATAEDVTQEVFIAVIRDAGRYDPARATVTAWLCGITRNLVRRRLERDRVMVPLDDSEPPGRDAAAASGSDPLADLTRAEGIETLRRAVSSLPVRYREAVVLCDLQEMSYADAADALGCAIGTVRSRLHRGRTLLAAKLRGTKSDERPLKLRGTRCLA
jgi:RNA polymerase sigma-70 factor (ECF subfamily)